MAHETQEDPIPLFSQRSHSAILDRNPLSPSLLLLLICPWIRFSSPSRFSSCPERDINFRYPDFPNLDFVLLQNKLCVGLLFGIIFWKHFGPCFLFVSYEKSLLVIFFTADRSKAFICNEAGITKEKKDVRSGERDKYRWMEEKKTSLFDQMNRSLNHQNVFLSPLVLRTCGFREEENTIFMNNIMTGIINIHN